MTPRIPEGVALGASALIVGFSLTGCIADPRAGADATPTADAARPTPRVTVTPVAPSPDAPSATPEAPAPTYADGSHSATGWYGSLPSHQDVTLTLDDDIITAVDITTPAEDETSLGYQQRFAAALPRAVVGRDTDDVAVDRLAGSSGCSEGFMNALAQIKEESTL